MKGMKKIVVLKFVIARRERSEGRGNPSCLEGYFLIMRFGESVDRRGLRPRDDKGVIFTMKGMKKIVVLKFVIARRKEWTTRQSIVYRDILPKGAVHLLRVSGSPRAYALAMTRAVFLP